MSAPSTGCMSCQYSQSFVDQTPRFDNKRMKKKPKKKTKKKGSKY